MVEREKKIEGIVVVPEPTRQILNPRQLEDYYGFWKPLIKWLSHLGKDPKKAEGYAFDTVRQRSYKINHFYRWLWEEERYTLIVTEDHADAYTKELVYEDASPTHKAAVQKSLKSLFKYLNHERGKTSTGNPKSSSLTAAPTPTRYGTSSPRKNAERSNRPASSTARSLTTPP